MSGVKSQMVNFESLSKIAEFVKKSESEVRAFAEEIINREGYRNFLVAYNIENLDKGIRADGSDIAKNPKGKQTSNKYERYTQYLKRKRGLESENVTLKDTGQFHGSIDVKIGYNDLIFLSRDPKADILEAIWGNVLGMTEEQAFEFADLIAPEIEKFLQKRINELI
jgi:hypothetical protein